MKYNLNLEERIQFVDGVVDLSKRNGKYDPHYMIMLSVLLLLSTLQTLIQPAWIRTR